MLKQLKYVIELRKKEFPWARVIWRFDHSSNHTKMAANALNAARMNVGPGGKQPKMRESIIPAGMNAGKRQTMIFEDGPLQGQSKGLANVLSERHGEASTAAIKGQAGGKSRKKILADMLAADADFQKQTTLIHDILTEELDQMGDICRFYPKYHCEFSPIERFWGTQSVL